MGLHEEKNTEKWGKEKIPYYFMHSIFVRKSNFSSFPNYMGQKLVKSEYTYMKTCFLSPIKLSKVLQKFPVVMYMLWKLNPEPSASGIVVYSYFEIK